MDHLIYIYISIGIAIDITYIPRICEAPVPKVFFPPAKLAVSEEFWALFGRLLKFAIMIWKTIFGSTLRNLVSML